MARRADRDQIVQPVGRDRRREQTDGRRVVDVQLPAQRRFGNPAIPAAEAVPFSRPRRLHFPVSAPVFRASPQDHAFPVVRKYRCPRVHAGFAAEVESEFPPGDPDRDTIRLPAVFARDGFLLSTGCPRRVRKTQLQLIRKNRTAASHGRVPGHESHLSEFDPAYMSPSNALSNMLSIGVLHE